MRVLMKSRFTRQVIRPGLVQVVGFTATIILADLRSF